MQLSRGLFPVTRLRTNLADRCLLFLFAPLSILLQGYIYGYHDHAIQIPYIHWRQNPALYPDDLLAESFPYYFAPFWDLIAYLSFYIPLYPLMLVAHVLFRWLLFESIFHLGIILTKNKSTALLASSFFIMPLHTLGDFFPSPDFVHSCVAVPALLYAITETIRGRHFVPFLLLGVVYNVHAMHSTFAALIILFILIHQPGRLRNPSVYLCGLLGLILAGPTLIAMFRSVSLVAGEEWVRTIRIRAPHHIFPFAWTWPWVSASIYFLGGYLCWRGSRIDHSGSVRMLLLAVLLICLVGTIGSELRPLPFVMRMHAFRCVIYAVLVFAVIWAQFLIQCVNDFNALDKRAISVVGLFVVCLGTASLIVSSYIPLLGAAIFLFWGRPRFLKAGSAITLFVPFCSVALSQFGYSIPLGGYLRDEALKTILVVALSVPLFVLFASRTLIVLPAFAWNYRHIISIFLISILCIGTIVIKGQIRGSSEWAVLLPHWIGVQRWAKEHTGVDDRFIVPPDLEGFRVYSERGIVASWKDGTAAFWYPALASKWLSRMVELRYIADSGNNIIDKYGDLTGKEFLDLGWRYSAGYAVVRKPSSTDLPRVYENEQFVVFGLKEPDMR